MGSSSGYPQKSTYSSKRISSVFLIFLLEYSITD